MHLRGEEAAQQKGRGKPKDLGKKAVLMNGPPGIGKTSSAMIITRSVSALLAISCRFSKPLIPGQLSLDSPGRKIVI